MGNRAKMKFYPSTCCSAVLLCVLLCPASIMAQSGQPPWIDNVSPGKQGASTTSVSSCFQAQDRQHSKEREKEAFQNLPEIARFWLTEDVVDLISPEERCAFLRLATERERDEFIEQFWSRRNPEPRSLSNSFEQEHYKRIVFANEKYGDEIPGWKTDRGRVYVAFGPPDSIESHHAGEKAGPPEEAAEANRHPWEEWHYRHIEGRGDNVVFEFVESSRSGDNHIVVPGMKDEWDCTEAYNLGHSSRGRVTAKTAPIIELYVGPTLSPAVQFRDLEAVANAQIPLEQVHFSDRIEFAKATDATTFTEILITVSSNEQSAQNRKNGNSSVEFEIFGRVSKPSGWVVDTFEHRISVERQRDPDDSHPDYRFNLALAPGTYRLAIVVKDLDNNRIGTMNKTMAVPPYEKVPGQE